MKITETYKYKKDDTIYIGSEPPKGSEILETLEILKAEKGKDLVRLSDEENVGSSIWLKDGDKQENYKEVERKNAK